MEFLRFIRRLFRSSAPNSVAEAATRGWTVEKPAPDQLVVKTTATDDAGLPAIQGDSPNFEKSIRYQVLCDMKRECMQSGRWAEAKPLGEETLKLSRELAGPESNETAICLRNLAWIYEELGDPQAHGLYEEAIAICEENLGMDHERTRRYREELAQLKTKPDPRSQKPASPEPEISPFLEQARHQLAKFKGDSFRTRTYGEFAATEAVRIAFFVDEKADHTYVVMKESQGWSARMWTTVPPAFSFEAMLPLLQSPANCRWTTADQGLETVRGIARALLPTIANDPLPFVWESQEGFTPQGEPIVVRRKFATGPGEITVHTRRVSGGTQVVIEELREAEVEKHYHNFFHDGQSQQVIPSGDLQELPF